MKIFAIIALYLSISTSYSATIDEKALAAASFYDQKEINPYKNLMQHIHNGANTKAIDKDGNTVLHLVIKSFVIYKATFTDRNNAEIFIKQSEITLHKVVAFLINAGADAKAKNKLGETPFDIALKRCHYDLFLKYLVSTEISEKTLMIAFSREPSTKKLYYVEINSLPYNEDLSILLRQSILPPHIYSSLKNEADHLFTQYGNEFMWKAFSVHDFESILNLINDGYADPNSPSKLGQNIIIAASGVQNSKYQEKILKLISKASNQSINYNLQDRNGNTILHNLFTHFKVAKDNKIINYAHLARMELFFNQALKKIMSFNPNLKIKNNFKKTAIDLALYRYHFDIVDSYLNETEISYKTVEMAISRKADKSKVTQAQRLENLLPGNDLLLEKRRRSTPKDLLKKILNKATNILNHHGGDLAWEAYNNQNHDLVIFFIQTGTFFIDVTGPKSHQNSFALEYSRFYESMDSNPYQYIKEILKYRPNINEQDYLGNTVLHNIIEHFHLKKLTRNHQLKVKEFENLVSYLIQNSADITITNKKGETPIDIALKKFHFDIVKKYINKTDINLRTIRYALTNRPASLNISKQNSAIVTNTIHDLAFENAQDYFRRSDFTPNSIVNDILQRGKHIFNQGNNKQMFLLETLRSENFDNLVKLLGVPSFNYDINTAFLSKSGSYFDPKMDKSVLLTLSKFQTESEGYPYDYIREIIKRYGPNIHVKDNKGRNLLHNIALTFSLDKNIIKKRPNHLIEDFYFILRDLENMGIDPNDLDSYSKTYKDILNQRIDLQSNTVCKSLLMQL